ncbi:hypothetical protein POM88_009143 [Heracleum sosnowskyi]|uniref:Uncharacterized protein n=1 Tax=Heracleum sosnowskyi TaxID=360622 RepID=A0AAD8JB59_9APIA|nr:hypothetical protein POM88_009143 [Heracleum sosnowskyi]
MDWLMINKKKTKVEAEDRLKEEQGLSWHLPCLETLHLRRPYYWKPHELCEPRLEDFPCLRTLLLDGFVLPNSISLPALTTLVLHIVKFPGNTSNMFCSLVNLRNLTLFFWTNILDDYVIKCPQLVNLEINVPGTTIGHPGQIIVVVENLKFQFC